MIRLICIAGLCASAAFARAEGILGFDAFFPANEYYEYNSYLGLITGYAPGLGDDNNEGIRPTGKVWRSGGFVQKYTISGWATGVASFNQGPGVTGDGTEYGPGKWSDPTKALGQATTSDTSDVVVLGDGGSIVLTFANGIGNGSGYDFVVYENALNDTFLELAFVEVSTDGEHFVRFPNFYLGVTPVGSDTDEGGGVNDPTKIYNLGSKYRIGYGNGYDLQELAQVAEYIETHYDPSTGTKTSSSVLSAEYMGTFLENYEYLDLANVQYVKIVDVVGDGNTLDSSGNPIYDAYPTHGTAGFDLSGVAVINEAELIPEPADMAWTIAAAALAAIALRRMRGR